MKKLLATLLCLTLSLSLMLPAVLAGVLAWQLWPATAAAPAAAARPTGARGPAAPAARAHVDPRALYVRLDTRRGLVLRDGRQAHFALPEIDAQGWYPAARAANSH